ncbi:MAG: exosortase, partial [Gammaproteobacteria bacterium]
MQSASQLSRLDYKSPVIFLICLVIISISFQETLSKLLSRWLVFDESYGHGLLVVATSLFLILRKLAMTGQKYLKPNWLYVFPLLLSCLILTLSMNIGVELLQFVLLPLLILFSFALIAGTAQAKTIIVPLGLLYFAVPIWDYLNNTLVEVTSAVVQYMVQLSGITAFITGNSIFIPSGEIVIAAGCSGLRYFIIGTFLGVLSSYLDFISLKRQLLLITTVILLSLVANWVRVYGITLIAYFSEMQSPLVSDHEVLGWVLFMSFMMPIFYFNSRYLPPLETSINTDDISQMRSMPLSQDQTGSILKISIAFIVLGLCLSAAPYTVNRFEGMQVVLPDISLPFRNGWIETTYTPARDTWQPQIEAPDTVTVRQYSQASEAVLVYQYLFVKVAKNDEILPYVSNMHGRDYWAIVNTRNLGGYKLLELVNKTTQQKVLVAYRFDIGG